jgi:hypothetical protein
MGKVKFVRRERPVDPEFPFIFHHRCGTVTLYASGPEEAVKASEQYGRGLVLVPAFEVPQTAADAA